MRERLTDNEIIKALKDEIKRANYIESYYIDCVDIGVFQNTLDLINRQNAEIERLKIFETTSRYWYEKCNDLVEELRTSKSEAIKDFVEQFIKRAGSRLHGFKYEYIIRDDMFYGLVEEMTEGGVNNE